jgi:ferrous iron transport protein B
VSCPDKSDCGRKNNPPGQLNITLVGPQNAGKTTLFNTLTGLNYKTVNYPGATVSYCVGQARPSLALLATIKDTPGIPSLTPSSPDHEVTCDQIFKCAIHDIVVAVIDATQLSRHLYLVEQLKESGFSLLLCVTMSDVLTKQNKVLDIKKLSAELGMPAVLVDARDEKSVKMLADAIDKVDQPNDVVLTPPDKILEEEIISRFKKIEAIEKSVLSHKLKNSDQPAKPSFMWDTLFLNPFLGPLIFFAILFCVFWSIFEFATVPMDFIDISFGSLIEWTKGTLGASLWVDFLADGIIAGIGSACMFLPQIIILFFFMSLLEDSGYLARGAMIIDKPLSKIGLNGRSFVPMLSGFACAIPAIMAARTIPSKKERLLTMFLVPLMGCSARLPVYVLLIAFITRDNPTSGGLIMASLYIGGIVIAAIIATIISQLGSYKKREQSRLMLELPSYRIPTIKITLMSTYHRSKRYLLNAGPIICLISTILWGLTTLQVAPDPGEITPERSVATSYAAVLGKWIEPVMSPMGLDWRGGVAIGTSFAAREVFVQSLALLYAVGDQGDVEEDDAYQGKLMARMDEVTFAGTDQKIFTVSTCVGLLFFFVVALQCFPTTVVAKAEMGGWFLPIIQLILYSLIAYSGAVAIVQIMRAWGYQ